MKERKAFTALAVIVPICYSAISSIEQMDT